VEDAVTDHDPIGCVTLPVPTVRLPEDLETPTPVVDIDVLDRNIAGMATMLSARGVGLRPHTKTSKCIDIIKRQVAAGVVGLTVATLGEAEVLADAGFTDLFQAYPVWAGRPERARRIRALHDRCDLLVGVESVEAAAALGSAVAGSGRTLGVLVEIDPGLHRSGVKPDGVLPIARAAERAGLDVVGAFTFGGHAYAGCEAPHDAAEDEVRVLDETRSALSGAGFDVRVLSAGCTPTVRLSARPPVTDERPGTYVFQDCQQVALGSAAPDSIALVVAATVVASHSDGHFAIDAGSKSLGSDRPTWLPGFGTIAEYPDAVIRSLSEHHGVAWTEGPRPHVGEVVRVVPNHCCIVVNLSDRLTIVRAGEIVGEWRVAGRGLNS
jgi:D-serine deaminase-like pyridoxal phosphate-dependent protein